MKILVTGGAGFIGTNLVRRLCELGHSVVALDDMTMGKRASLEGIPCSVIVGDVTDRWLTFELASHVDLIYHLACKNILCCLDDPARDLTVNAAGTLVVLEAARWHGKRVVYTSSSSIYGNAVQYPTEESAAPNLLTPYSVSKYAGENYCRIYHDKFKVPVSILRLTNNYGPYQTPGVVSRFMEQAKRGMAPILQGDGLQTRDFIYVRDTVEALVRAGESTLSAGQIINIGTGKETSIKELAYAIMRLNGLTVPLRYSEPRASDGIFRRAVSTSKARYFLNWEAVTSLEDGLKQTMGWINEHCSNGSTNVGTQASFQGCCPGNGCHGSCASAQHA